MKNGFLKSYSDSKNVKYSSINVAFCALIIAIVIILNAMIGVFSEKFHWQLDMTEEGIFTMSEKMEAAVEDIFDGYLPLGGGTMRGLGVMQVRKGVQEA